VTDNYVNELLDVYVKQKKVKRLGSIIEEGPKIGMNPDLLDVETSISHEYELEQEIISEETLGINKLFEDIKYYYLKNDDISFLIYFLEWCLLTEDYLYPKSSVLENVEQQWGSILLTQFNKKPNKQFLKDLSYRWFYFVNKYSIPYQKDDLDIVILQYRKKYHKDIKLRPLSNISDD